MFVCLHFYEWVEIREKEIKHFVKYCWLAHQPMTIKTNEQSLGFLLIFSRTTKDHVPKLFFLLFVGYSWSKDRQRAWQYVVSKFAMTNVVASPSVGGIETKTIVSSVTRVCCNSFLFFYLIYFFRHFRNSKKNKQQKRKWLQLKKKKNQRKNRTLTKFLGFL